MKFIGDDVDLFGSKAFDQVEGTNEVSNGVPGVEIKDEAIISDSSATEY